MTDISKIVKAARSIISGENFSYEQLDLINWEVNKLYEKDVNYLWLSIRRFVDDEDIRINDMQYDADLRTGISEDLKYLLSRIEDNK